MDDLVTIYHGGTVENDRYGYVEFLDMQSVPVLFNDRSSFLQMSTSIGNYYYYLFLQYVCLVYHLHDILIVVFLGRRKLWVQ